MNILESGTGQHLYDTIEPAVIDEKMLQKAIEDQGPKAEAGRIAKQEGVDFDEVNQLRLDFRNIHKMDNLWCLKNLTKLQLDNNIIETIEGLEQLIHLVWLDLSFNNIEVISGLDKLIKLEDLTLFHNRITQMEGLDQLSKLHVLSIGNNKIALLDNLIYLRKFGELRTLNLAGNPLCEAAEYKPFVLAHLPGISYLDYRLIDPVERTAACEKYYIQIEELAINERQAKRKEVELANKADEFRRHHHAYVENLDGSQLFQMLYEGDSEGRKINTMPGMDEVLEAFKEKFSAVCHQLFELGLHNQQKRQKEVDLFWECLNEAKEESGRESKKLVDAFMQQKEKVLQEIAKIQDPEQVDARLNNYNNEIMRLWDQLMTYEMQLVDQIEEVVKDFQTNLGEMVANFLEEVKHLTAQLRDLENGHHEKLMEISMVVLEKVLKNEVDEEISDELRDIMVDKDTVTQAVTSSHDYHLLKIDNREDELVQRINGWMNELFAQITQQQEVKRNRDRVSEISNLIDQLKNEMDNIDAGQPA